MKTLVANPEYGLYEKEGRAFCSSRQIADTFNKRHDIVLRDIRDLDCSISFRLHNFEESSYKNTQNKKQPEYLMTKDGFVFLVMGYRGKKAAAFKEAYIKRFNEMEAFIKSYVSAKEEFPALTNAILMAHEKPKRYHFSNEINMIYRIVTGMGAKAIRQQRGIADGKSIRPYLSNWEMCAVEELQRADIGLLVSIHEFEKRKEILVQYLQKLISSKRLAA